MRVVATLLLGIMILVTSVPAKATGLGIRGYYWIPDLSGGITVDGDSLSGTDIDFINTLALDETTVQAYEAYLSIGNQGMSLSYASARYRGTQTLTQDMAFDGQLYPAHDSVDSRMDYSLYDLTYQYDIIPTSIFCLGVLSKFTVFDGTMSTRSALYPTRQEKDFTATIPLFGATIRLGLINFLEVDAFAACGYAKDKAYTGGAELVFRPLPNLGLHGGYRMQSFKVSQDEVDLTLRNAGPYAAVTLGF